MFDHIPGAPLKSLTWRRVPETVKIVFREDMGYQAKLDFLWQLAEAANAFRAHLLRHPDPDYEPHRIDWEKVAALNLSMPANLMEVLRGGDHAQPESDILNNPPDPQR